MAALIIFCTARNFNHKGRKALQMFKLLSIFLSHLPLRWNIGNVSRTVTARHNTSAGTHGTQTQVYARRRRAGGKYSGCEASWLLKLVYISSGWSDVTPARKNVNGDMKSHTDCENKTSQCAINDCRSSPWKRGNEDRRITSNWEKVTQIKESLDVPVVLALVEDLAFLWAALVVWTALEKHTRHGEI